MQYMAGMLVREPGRDLVSLRGYLNLKRANP